MLRRALLFTVAAAACAAVPTAALAQKHPAKNAAGYEEKVKARHLDFDDDLVETDTVSPEGFPVNSKIPPKFNSLIKMRTNFVHEMIKSGDDA